MRMHIACYVGVLRTAANGERIADLELIMAKVAEVRTVAYCRANIAHIHAFMAFHLL
jgi:hypothetical protein